MRGIDWGIFILLGVCGVVDARKKQMPVLLLIGMSVIVGGSLIFFKTEHMKLQIWGGLLGVLFFVISKCTNQAVGYGDSWIIMLLGISYGIFVSLKILFLASVAAGMGSLFFLWKQRWKRNTTIPFVPFLAVAYLGVMLL